MYFGFAGRIIANPGEKFFDQPVIVSDDPELAGISPTYPNPAKRELARALKDGEQLPDTLAAHDIRFVLLAKEFDYQDYGYLGELPGAAVVHDSETLTLYELRRGNRP
jgi:hypothetical protein